MQARVSSTLPVSLISALFPHNYRSNHQQSSWDITQTSHIAVFTRPFRFVVVFIAHFTVPVSINYVPHRSNYSVILLFSSFHCPFYNACLKCFSSSWEITQTFHIKVIIRSFSFLVVFIALFTVPVSTNFAGRKKPINNSMINTNHFNQNH